MRWPRQHLPILALIAVSLALGAVLAPHFGQGIDESYEADYGARSLQSYREPFRVYRGGRVLQATGPFYLMVWVSAAGLLEKVVPLWSDVDARHFVNFTVFQVAVVSVYLLARRIARPSVALVAALLFETQPLLFGHGFINHKDTSLMAFFAAAMVIGLSSVDRYVRRIEQGQDPELLPSTSVRSSLRASWIDLRPTSRAGAMICVGLAAGIPILRALLNDSLQMWVGDVVRAAHNGTAWGPLTRLFERVADNVINTPVSAYTGKAIFMMDAVAAVASVSLLALAAVLVRSLWWETALRFASEVLRFSGPAGVVLGMAIAIRTVALSGGMLVAGYAWLRAGRRSVPLLVTYGLVCVATAYLLWPQLWAVPIEFLRANLASSLRYPEVHEVLFRRQMLDSITLPRVFLPWMLATQLTLPALGLCLVSLPAALWLARRSDGSRVFVWILAAWFLLPLAAVVAFQPALYNNFRHLLFILPPLFVLGAFGLDRLLEAAGRPGWLLPALAAVLLIPGLAGIVRLHPYEYIYYNELVGGVRGAYGAYELDYWCTSYREAARAVNAIAPAGSTIAVWGPVSAASPFLRPDLTSQHLLSSQVQTPTPGSVAMGCSWATMADDFLPSYETVWTVERDGVSLALVKRPPATRPLGDSTEATEGDTSGHRASEDLGVDPP